MPSAFNRTTRSLDLDHFRFPLVGVILSCLFLSLWIVWALVFKIALYQVSKSARIEVASAVYPVQTSVTARLLRAQVSLGQQVQLGDTLFFLDAQNLHLRLQEQESRYTALKQELAALQKSISAEETAMQREHPATQTELEEAKSLFREGDAAAQFAEGEARRLKLLFDKGLIAEAALLSAQAEADKKRASAEALRLKIDRLSIEHSIRLDDRQSHLEGLRRDAARIAGDLQTSEKTAARLTQDIEHHVIRAPIAGIVGELVELRPGSFVKVSEKLATIVPNGENRIVASLPYAGMGRILPGQRAKMRVDAYPWIHYGTIKAIVSEVGSEPQRNGVRVELAIDAAGELNIPLRHGLTGRVEIDVERVTPAGLMLRKVAGWVNRTEKTGMKNS